MGERDLEYAWPSDDLSRQFTPTLTAGTAATGYPVTNLANDDPAFPFKTNETSFRLLWDFLVATAVEYVLLVHHNFAEALPGVTFAMGSTPSTTDFSRDFTIRPYHEDEFPVNEHLDLRDVTPTYRYASLEVQAIGSPAGNVVACSLGKFPILTRVRALDGNLMLDVEEDESHPLVEHKTDVGVSTIYIHGTRWRWLRGDKIQEASDAANIRAWNRATMGRGVPFVLIPHIDLDANALTSPVTIKEESMIVRWEENNLPRTYFGPDLLSRYRLKFEEVSRGLKPTPSAV